MTCPLPLPLDPPVIVIHDVLVDAFHAQPLPALTETVAEPAVAPRVALTGESHERAGASFLRHGERASGDRHRAGARRSFVLAATE